MRIFIAIFASAILLWSCSKDEEPFDFTWNGIIQNVTERGIRNAEIKIFQDGSLTPIHSIVTQDGKFNVKLDPGHYRLEASAVGYDSYTGSFQVENQGDMILATLEGNASVSGKILNSQTGQGLSNARVAFSFNPNVDNADDADLVVETDGNGNYNIEGAPVGELTQVVESDGFFTRVTPNVTFEEGANNLTIQTMVEHLDQGGYRIVLTWGTTPEDLDAHLTGPTGVGSGKFHVYFGIRQPANSNSTLDVDDLNGGGPETITITAVKQGKYRFSVHNYTAQGNDGADGIKLSPAVVELYDHTGLINTFTPPNTGTAEKNTWRVFEINVTSALVPTVSNSNSYRMAAGVFDTSTFREKEKNMTFDIDEF